MLPVGWKTSFLYIHTSSSQETHGEIDKKEDNMILVSNWKAEVVRETETMGKQPSIVEYSVPKSPESGFQIHWI